MHTLPRLATGLLVKAAWITLVVVLVATLLAVMPDTSNEVILAPGPFNGAADPAGVLRV